MRSGIPVSGDSESGITAFGVPESEALASGITASGAASNPGPNLGPNPGPPPRRLWWGEARALGELLGFALRRRRLLAALPSGRRHVLVFPGFLVGDAETAPLRGALSALGHRVEGWKLGRNLGLRPGRFEAMEARFLQFAGTAPDKVVLLGWSLGGLYAVELARRHPGLVRQVITLGAPVSGLLRANHAWGLYERLAGHEIDAPPIAWQPGALPGVPLCAVAASRDGIVHRAAAHARPGAGVENLLVEGTHCGLPWNAQVLRLVAERLASG